MTPKENHVLLFVKINLTEYMTASVACGWAGAVMQVILVIWPENPHKSKVLPTDQPTDAPIVTYSVALYVGWSVTFYF